MAFAESDNRLYWIGSDIRFFIETKNEEIAQLRQQLDQSQAVAAAAQLMLRNELAQAQATAISTVVRLPDSIQFSMQPCFIDL